MTKTVPKSMGITNDNKTLYPYVVIRWMAAVYGRMEIVFKSEGTTGVEGKTITYVHPEPFSGSGLKPECRDEIVEIIKAVVLRTSRRMCLVLSEESCIFVEPDGTTRAANDPPSGGLRIDDVKIVDPEK